MRRTTHIASDLTVRQVATIWPVCAPLLERYPGARCDGRWTLQELKAFARDQRLEQRKFLRALATAAGVEVAETCNISHDPSPMPLIFLALAVCLTIGGGWGVMLLLRIAWGASYGAASGASIHVHGLAELWGWMALFIFGVASHLLRQNTKRPAPPWLEYAAAGCVIAALLIFFVGLLAPVRASIPDIDVFASAGLAGSTVLFGISMIWSLTGRSQSQRIHGSLFLIGWLWVWAEADLWLRLHYATAPVLPDAARTLLSVLPVLGFATNAIYGFGIRLIPGLLNLRQLHPRSLAIAILLHNAGLVLFLLPTHLWGILGAALMVGASVLYLIGMDLLRTKPARPIYGVDIRGHIFIRAAFFWLVCALVMIFIEQVYPGLPHAYDGAWRHALTVGFATTMILGVGHRIVPIFIKQPLASTRLMLISALLIIVGNAGRVGLELATISGGSWTFGLMGITGLLEGSALVLFALNLILTVRRRRHIYSACEPLTVDTRVREAVNARPELQQQLNQAGITMLDDAPFIAPSMTFGALALAWGGEPAELLAELCSENKGLAPAQETFHEPSIEPANA
ncbi:MAG TPA: hypothetical protein VG722_05895 [Tepidisphaeraceae bacterium]|nr:hypothetical protein [Tepidisphaeraceae bacterium]